KDTKIHKGKPQEPSCPFVTFVVKILAQNARSSTQRREGAKGNCFSLRLCILAFQKDLFGSGLSGLGQDSRT
ncbi:MAG: hypothetical protein Q7T47_08825, partial [Anaerolineales bacterium]|nr:hypothetical protein [Anaerolineales bacterium]